MYVRAMGAVASGRGFKPGTVVLRIPLNLTRRGMGQVECPAGQTPTNMYDGSIKCCGGPTPESDPCSFLNTPGYVQTQSAAQTAAIAGAAGPMNAAMLASLSSYPQNVQQDAIDCVSNPGQTLTDAYGMTVHCPAASMSPVPGINVSIYTPAQIAAMIAGGATPAYETPVNVAGTSVPASVPPAGVQSGYTVNGYLVPGGAPSTGGGSKPPASPAVIQVTMPAGSSSGALTAASPTSVADLGTQISSALTGSVNVGGISAPIWALAAGGLALLWFMGKH